MKIKIEIPQALQILRPEAQWVIRGDDLEWLDTIQSEPTELEIANEIIRLEEEYKATEYQRDRAEAYPSLAEQADMQFHDAVDGTSTWLDAISAVKLQFPKETI